MKRDVRVWVTVTAFAIGAACTLDRSIPLEQFACSAEGPCPDAGPRDGSVRDGGPLRDAGSRDGGFLDSGVRDGGFPDAGVRDGGLFEGCPGVIPAPSDGRLVGNVNTESNDITLSCPEDDLGDGIYGFYAPGRLESLTVDGRSSPRLVSVATFDRMCQTERACTDMYYDGRVLTFEDIEAGPFALAVDASSDFLPGPYDLEVRGAVANGEACVQGDALFPCALGECIAGLCTVYDCLGDNIDNDEDGMTDEDSGICFSQATVSCSAQPGPYLRGNPIGLFGQDDGSANIIQRRWKIVQGRGPRRYFVNDITNTSTASLRIDDFGTVVARYSVVYAGNHVTSCDLPITVETDADLVVEATWNDTFEDGEIHFLHPMASSWFDDLYTCNAFDFFDNCSTAFGPAAENVVDIDDNLSGSELLTLPAMLPSAAPHYGVGLAFFEPKGAVQATVRIYCLGTLAFEDAVMVPAGDFWKVADVAYDGTTCTVTPIQDVTMQPLVVSESVARMTR